MNIGVDIRPLMDKIKTGVGEYTFELLNAVFSIDKTNQYWLFYNSRKEISDNLPKWTQDNVHYIGLNLPNKLLSFLLFLKIIKLDNLVEKKTKEKINIWFTPNLNFTNISKNTPHVLVIHDLTNELYRRFFTKRQQLRYEIIQPKKQCRQASLIITPSENTKHDLINLYDIHPDKIKVIYPGLSLAFSTNTKPINLVKTKYHLPEKFILFLGTIEPRKNIICVIEAFEKSYSKLTTPHCLVIAGAPGWKNKKIYNKIENSPLKEKIKLINYIDPEDKPALYQAASLFVYPSFYEGFGFPILEAFANGLPVITSNRSSIPEITGTSAYLINPNNPTNIAEGIINILNKDNKQPIKYDLQKFSWDTAAAEWVECLKNL